MAKFLGTYNDWMNQLSGGEPAEKTQAPATITPTPAPGKQVSSGGGGIKWGGTTPTLFQQAAGGFETAFSRPALDTGNDMVEASQPAAPTPTPTYNIDFTPYLGGAQTEGGQYAGLFAPLQENIGDYLTELQDRSQNFLGEIGSTPSFDQRGGTGILDEFINQGAGEDQARALLGAQYTGPQGLDVADLRHQAEQLGLLGQNLNTVEGLGALLGEQGVRLTPGELRFEARHLQGDDTFQAEAQAQRQALRYLLGALGAGEQQAAGIGTARSAEEQAVADAARAYLTGRGGEISGAVEQQLGTAQERQAAVDAAYSAFQETGDAAKLLETAKLLDPEGFEAYQAWKTQRDAVMNDPRFAKLTQFGIPEMVYDETQLGSPWRFEDKWYQENLPRFGDNYMSEVKDLARQRQKALADLGEAPGSGAFQMADQWGRQAEAQKLHDEILARPEYAGIKDIPVMKPMTDQRGHYVWHIKDPQGDWVRYDDAVTYGYITPQQRDQLAQRQEELEQNFGGIEHYVTARDLGHYWRDPSAFAPGSVGELGPGQYADVLNLYLESPREQLPDPRRFLELSAAQPTRHSAATDEQREQYNRIQSLLGQADRLYQAPGTQTQLLQDTDRYLNELARAERLRRGEQLDELSTRTQTAADERTQRRKDISRGYMNDALDLSALGAASQFFTMVPLLDPHLMAAPLLKE